MYGFPIILALIAVAWLLGLWRQRGRHGVRQGEDDGGREHRDPPARGWTFGSKEM